MRSLADDGAQPPFIVGQSPQPFPAHDYQKHAVAGEFAPPSAPFPGQPPPLPPREMQAGPHSQGYLAALRDGSMQYVVFSYAPPPGGSDAPWITHPPSSQPSEPPHPHLDYAPYVPGQPMPPSGPLQHVQPHSFPSSPVQFGPSPGFQLFPPSFEPPTQAYHTAPSSPTKPQYPHDPTLSHLVVADHSAMGGGWYSHPAPLPDHPRRASDAGQAWSSIPTGPAMRGGRGRGRGRPKNSRSTTDGRASGAGAGNARAADGGAPAKGQWATPAGGGPHPAPVYGLGFVAGSPLVPSFGLQPTLYPQQSPQRSHQPGTPSVAGWPSSQGRRRGSSGPPARAARAASANGQANAGPSSTSSTPAPWPAGPPDAFYAGVPTAPASWGAAHLLGPPFVPRVSGPHPLPRKPSVEFSPGQQQVFSQ